MHIMERRWILVNRLLAINDKQLGICLRMLYAESVDFRVMVGENAKQKIEFYVYPVLADEKFREFENRYRIMIS